MLAVLSRARGWGPSPLLLDLSPLLLDEADVPPRSPFPFSYQPASL